MKRLNSLALLAAGLGAGIGGSFLYYGYWPEPKPAIAAEQHDHGEAHSEAANGDHGGHDMSDHDMSGHDLSGRDRGGLDMGSDDHTGDGKADHAAGKGDREILYYRNPMGLPDTSPVPKKDSMGMDYIPVYADEAEGGDTIKVSLDKIQRSGVKTEMVGRMALSREVRGVGTVEHDESTLSVVTVRSDGYIEDLFVDRMGQDVRTGEPMFRFYSPQIQLAQVDLLVSLRTAARTGADREVEGAIQKLRNLDIPQSRIEQVLKTKENPRTLDWPAPATGHIVSKNVLKGQFVEAGDELFRIANTDHVWVIAEVAEADIGEIAVDTPASVTLRAFPNKTHQGKVAFVYPHMTNMETRTVPVRIELPNPDGEMRPGMYAGVVFHPGADAPKAIAVPDDAVIDSGARTVVLIAKGEGRFQPREVGLGRRGEGYVEILKGVAEGEEVVTSATFLIDSESKLKAALQAFDRDEAEEEMSQ